MKIRVKALAGSLFGVGLLWLGYLGIRTEMCRRIIDQEWKRSMPDETALGNRDGVICLWRVGKQENVGQTPTLWQVICGARPTEVWLASYTTEEQREPLVTVERARRMGGALKFFGSLKLIDIQDSGDEAMALFMALGRQPNMIDVYAFRSPITDEVCGALKGFPRLHHLEIFSQYFTGRGFPALPELEFADFDAPISAEGLRAICASPKLGEIIPGFVPPLPRDYEEAIRDIKAKHPKLKGLDFEPSK